MSCSPACCSQCARCCWPQFSPSHPSGEAIISLFLLYFTESCYSLLRLNYIWLHSALFLLYFSTFRNISVHFATFFCRLLHSLHFAIWLQAFRYISLLPRFATVCYILLQFATFPVFCNPLAAFSQHSATSLLHFAITYYISLRVNPRVYIYLSLIHI